jgi:hypothetical protein
MSVRRRSCFGLKPQASSLRLSGQEIQRSSHGISLWPGACSLWLMLVCLSSTALAQRSPFNGLDVLPADSNGHYRILIGGHFHGASTNKSGYPAATLLANLDTINALGANLFLSTGDLFLDPVKDQSNYERAFFSKLKIPFFNAPGNHDVVERTDRALDKPFVSVPRGLDSIQVRKGSVEMSFPRMQMPEIVLLDLERTGGVLDEDHLKRLSLLNEADYKNVFIISHRPIWAEDDPQYSELFEGNTRSVTGTNFKKDVYPLLEKIAQHAHVYWISGSMGGFAPSSIFMQQHAKNITFIQCAIRDEPRDALLIADGHPDTVKWSAISLTGQKLLSPEKYDAAWWREHLKKDKPGFSWRLLPLLIKNTILRVEFWWGLAAGMLVLVLIRRLYRR